MTTPRDPPPAPQDAPALDQPRDRPPEMESAALLDERPQRALANHSLAMQDAPSPDAKPRRAAADSSPAVADAQLLDERLQRVLAVVRAGKRVADPADSLGREARERLPSATGLSRASVEMALTEHLETSPSREELLALVRGAGAAARCHVVLSANVCTASLRALAIACATAPRVLAKPSRRDPVVTELLARALAGDDAFAAAGGVLSLVSEATPSPGDELHVYGSDETIQAIRATLREGVILRAHGAGFGVAIIGADAGVEEATAALARDVVAFDQRGCLSPRAAIVIGGAERGMRVMRSLARELSAWNERAPRGALTANDRADLRRYVETSAALGASIEGDGFAVGLDEAPAALLLPPAVRAVHVAPASSDDLAPLLAPWASKIAAIGLAGSDAVPEAGRGSNTGLLEALRIVGPGANIRLLEALRIVTPGARFSKIGWMQRPPLDGPVDLRAFSPPR